MAHRGRRLTAARCLLPRASRWVRTAGIVDEAHGRQPFRSLDGRTVCVINGEIYNHDELRRELPDYEFRSRCDAEVVLAGFLRWGIAVVRRLRGMFAIAIADSDGRLWLARDPLGIKPLYWARKGGCTLVASELKGSSAWSRRGSTSCGRGTSGATARPHRTGSAPRSLVPPTVSLRRSTRREPCLRGRCARAWPLTCRRVTRPSPAYSAAVSTAPPSPR